MGAKTPTSGRVVLTNNDTYTPQGPNVLIQPRALTWSGSTTAKHKAAITNTDGTTMLLLTVGTAGDTVVLDTHFFGDTRPWKGPITATMDSGTILLYI